MFRLSSMTCEAPGTNCLNIQQKCTLANGRDVTPEHILPLLYHVINTGPNVESQHKFIAWLYLG